MASAAFSFFSFEPQRRHFSRSSAGKDDLVCLRVGLSIDSRGTLVGGPPPPSSSSSRQCHDISNFPGVQGSLSKVDSNTLMIKKVQKEHIPETESDCKTRSNFRALFYRVSRAFGCDQNVHVALVTLGAQRSTRNLPYVTITHSHVLAFFATGCLLLFRSHFCRNCSFTRRYQHDSVLELFLHFGRRTTTWRKSGAKLWAWSEDDISISVVGRAPTRKLSFVSRLLAGSVHQLNFVSSCFG